MKILNGKIALVTSSTRGIGKAIAEKLAENGAKVYFAVRRLEAGEELVKNLEEKGLLGATVFFDAYDENSYINMIKEVVEKEGRIDILVNNYGSTDVNKDIDLVNGDTDAYFEIVNRNIKSVYLTSKEAVKSMQKTGGGNIVNISSIGSIVPDMSRIAYVTAKAAINSLTENIAIQYARDNIRCNAILPGFIATDAAMDNMSEDFLTAFLKNVPLNRPGTPEDIANAALFLSSDMSSFITGEIIEVAGGFAKGTPLYGMYQDMGKRG